MFCTGCHSPRGTHRAPQGYSSRFDQYKTYTREGLSGEIWSRTSGCSFGGQVARDEPELGFRVLTIHISCKVGCKNLDLHASGN